MPNIENPAKSFQFRITVPGLNPFLAQECDLPEKFLDIVEHGDVNFMVKTAGMVKIGNFTVDKIKPADDTDNFAWDWLDDCQNTLTGGGLLPSEYKKNALLEQLGNDGVSSINSWLCKGTWPNKINGVKFSRTSSTNTVERIEFCVDELPKIA